MPARGFSLELLERGGENFVKDAFRESRVLLNKRKETARTREEADAVKVLDIGDCVSVPLLDENISHHSGEEDSISRHHMLHQKKSTLFRVC